MLIKEDEIYLSFYKNSQELENAAKCLDENFFGIVCDKNGNVLYINEKAKRFTEKTSVTNIKALAGENEAEVLGLILLEGRREAFELSETGDFLLIFPASNDLRCIIRLNLGVRNFEDIFSLLRTSTQYMEILERVFDSGKKSADKPRRLISERISRILQLVELTELPARPYGEINYDLTELTRKLCEYASVTLSECGGAVEFKAAAAVPSRIDPELYILLFCASVSLVMCKSEDINMKVCLEYDEADSKICHVRFRCESFSQGASLFLTFLEYACVKLGLDCAVISDRTLGITEFSISVETESGYDGFVGTSVVEAEVYNISKYLHLLSGRIYTAI